MKNFLRNLTGILLMVAAAGGALLCLAGLVIVWIYRPAITASLTANVALTRSTLETTAAGLTIADQSLQSSIDSIGALQGTVQTTADTIQASTPLVNTMATLTGKDLPDTYVSAQAALLAAQESAKIIDQVLQTLNSLPFVSPNLYNPPVPLNVALAQISISMQNIPGSLATMQASLNTASQNLAAIQAGITLMATDINSIQTSLEEAKAVVEQYQGVVNDLLARAQNLERRLPTWINASYVLVTILLLWAGIAQIGLFLQGWSLVETKNSR
jgi:methyl-accepting chemotaxis protein